MKKRDEATEQIRNKIDIGEYIGRVVALKKVGNNFVGLCPFHEEKSPSFTVSPRKGFYHCFGCNASGDIFQFVIEHEGISFKEAFSKLAFLAGVDLTPIRDRLAELKKHSPRPYYRNYMTKEEREEYDRTHKTEDQ